MTFAKPTPLQKATGLKADKTGIHYNFRVTLDGNLLEAYDSIVMDNDRIDDWRSASTHFKAYRPSNGGIGLAARMTKP